MTLKEKSVNIENVAFLKYLLKLELRRLCEKNHMAMILLMGVGGQVFALYHPPKITKKIHRLFNSVKTNLPYICAQLRNRRMEFSIQRYIHGTTIMAEVNMGVVLVCLLTSTSNVGELNEMVSSILIASKVINHILSNRALTDYNKKGYAEKINHELKELNRVLFEELFHKTSRYQKNMKILKEIKGKLESVLGIGIVEQVITLALNELGLSPRYMVKKDWLLLVRHLIETRIRPTIGDVVAERLIRNWIPEIENKLESFL